MTAGEADWEKVALVAVRGRRGPAGACGGLGEEARWAGPRSETPAWAGWCAGAGRGAVCAGCGSGSCAEAGVAPRSGETAERRTRDSYLQQLRELRVFYRAAILTRHSRRSAGVMENMNDANDLFECPSKTMKAANWSRQMEFSHH